MLQGGLGVIAGAALENLDELLEIGNRPGKIALGKTGDATWKKTVDVVIDKYTYTDDTRANAWTLSASYYF